MKSGKSRNPFKSIPVPYSSGIRTIYDFVKANGGDIKVASNENKVQNL